MDPVSDVRLMKRRYAAPAASSVLGLSVMAALVKLLMYLEQ